METRKALLSLRRLGWLLGGLAALAVAFVVFRQMQTRFAGRANIRVTVRDVETGQPVKGAIVSAAGGTLVRSPRQAGTEHAASDARGVALVPRPQLPQRFAHFCLWVEHTNYASRVASWYSPAGTLNGSVPTNHTFQLERGVTIGGLVRDEVGSPVTGASVIASSPEPARRRSREAVIHEESSVVWRDVADAVRTDARGFWRRAGFPVAGDAQIDVITEKGTATRFSTRTADRDRVREKMMSVSLSELLSTNALLQVRTGLAPSGNVAAARRSNTLDQSVEVLAAFGASETGPSGRTNVDQAASQQPISAVVLRPDGQPAPQAKVRVSESLVFGSEFLNPLWQTSRSRLITGPDGSCQVAPYADNNRVVAWHPTGLARLSMAVLRRNPKIQLQPWARIEGVLRAGAKPLAGERIDLTCPIFYGVHRSPFSYHVHLKTTTDSEGRFVFADLPPGDSLLYRIPAPIKGRSERASHRWPLALRAGETQRVDYSFGGRTVVGRVETGAWADWQNDWHYLLSKTADRRDYGPTYDGRSDWDEYANAYEGWAVSPARLAIEREIQLFQMVFDPDGNFRIEDLPPGTYEMRLNLTKPPVESRQAGQRQREELGSLVQDMTIPPGAPGEEFDFGTIEMQLNSPGLAKRAASFKATQLDGRELDLEKLRGQPVVLVFWAEWAPQSEASLAGLRTLREGLSATQRLACITLNIDGDVPAARRATAALEAGWTHAVLHGPDLFQATEQIGVHTLPSTLLLDATGRLVARDADRKRLLANLARLSKAPVTKPAATAPGEIRP